MQSNQSVSVGTWGNQQGRNGVWFNLERYFIQRYDIDTEQYDRAVGVSLNINSHQLNLISTFILDNDEWTLRNNCSWFVAGLWNLVSPDAYALSSNLFNVYTPNGLRSQIVNFDNHMVGFTCDDPFIRPSRIQR